MPKTKWYIGHVPRKNKQVIVTITSSTQGTTVYADGTLARHVSVVRTLECKDLTGQLVVGNYPLADNGWRGQLRGLAIYNRELTAAEVLQHYEAWTTNQQAKIKNEGPAALYLYNEGTGNVVHSQMNSGNRSSHSRALFCPACTVPRTALEWFPTQLELLQECPD